MKMKRDHIDILLNSEGSSAASFDMEFDVKFDVDFELDFDLEIVGVIAAGRPFRRRIGVDQSANCDIARFRLQ